MNILFLVPYPEEGPSNRYRIEQYLPYLRQLGHYYWVRPFWNSRAYRILYKNGYYFKKAFYFFLGTLNRFIDILAVFKYDVVFIHRESYPFGPPFFEWLIHKFKKPIIFDFDDAIFLQNFNPANRIYRFLKFSSKTKKIVNMSSAVIVANKFLEEYALRYNSRVYIIPTSIDTEKFTIKKRDAGKLVIGWIGSPTTSPYLNIIFDAMRKLSGRYDFVFKIVGAGKPVVIKGVNIQNCDWQLEREILDFQSIDIGVYPLPDTLWVRGKAAFKAIQYMSVGVPVVASPVGMAKEIIQDGVNGFLAGSDEEWVKKISILIEDRDLRARIGLEGRKTAEQKFSVKANVEILKHVIGVSKAPLVC